MVRIFATYTYKGGAAKTTTAINLASVFANSLDRNVLVVDCDPQCNLTSFFLKDREDDPGELLPPPTPSEELEEEAVAIPVLPPGVLPAIRSEQPLPQHGEGDIGLVRNGFMSMRLNLHTLLAPVYNQGLTNVADGSPLETCIDRLPRRSSNPDVDNAEGRIWILPGSSKIVEFEKTMAVDNALWPLIRGGFRRLINKIAQRLNIDIVICDFGPSSSLLNMAWVASCDFILPCCFPDYFSATSLDGLIKTVLPKMLKDRQRVVRAQNERIREMLQAGLEGITEEIAAEFALPPNPPKILPVIVTNFTKRSYTQTRNYAAGAYVCVGPSKWILTMRTLMQQADIPAEVSQLFTPSGRGTPDEEMVIALYPTVNTTQQLSHDVGYPVTMLTRSFLRRIHQSGRILEQNVLMQTVAKKAFISLAQFCLYPDLD